MIQPKISVGGREVLASGSITFAPGETMATIEVKGLIYIFVFAHSVGVPAIANLYPSDRPGSVVVTFAGDLSRGASWHWHDFGMWDGRRIALSTEIRFYGANPTLPPTIGFNYTFSSGQTNALASAPTPNIYGGAQ